jgi:hypothetical protein
MALTAAASPSSFSQSSTGRFELVATLSLFLTVGFSHARYPQGKCSSSIGMGQAAAADFSKAKGSRLRKNAIPVA